LPGNRRVPAEVRGRPRGTAIPVAQTHEPGQLPEFPQTTPDALNEKLGIKEPGKAAHAFRRFRSSILAKSGVEEDIRKFWLGHENNDITAQYAEQIREDNVWRQTLAANVGLGFKIPAFVPKSIVRNVRKNRQVVEVAVVS
jgi:hypothetical protein